MTVMLKMICKTCGSEEVLSDAYAEWDYPNQEWTVQNTFDKGGYCVPCDGEIRIKAIEEVLPDG